MSREMPNEEWFRKHSHLFDDPPSQVAPGRVRVERSAPPDPSRPFITSTPSPTRPRLVEPEAEPTVDIPRGEWLMNAADLLAEPDPGPTAWLVEDLIVDGAIVAAVGRWKTTKSYGLLHTCIAIATGQPAFGTNAIPKPGPVVFCNEESGRAALWRRLDSLARGYAVDPEDLRGQLEVSANARIKLDDVGWQDELVAIGRDLRPRAFVFDPLARMKASARKENEQTDMAVLVEFIRRLRDETGAAVCFVHHVGHTGDHMRGSSDLESAWESRLTWKRDGQSPLVTVESEHREAEAGDPVTYRIAWDGVTRTMRFQVADVGPPLAERIADWLREHGSGTTDEIRAGVGVRKSDVQRTLETLKQAGTTHRGPSGRRDRLGRPIADRVWKLTSDAGLWPVPDLGRTTTTHDDEHRGSVARPVSLETGGTDQPPDDPPHAEPLLPDDNQEGRK